MFAHRGRSLQPLLAIWLWTLLRSPPFSRSPGNLLRFSRKRPHSVGPNILNLLPTWLETLKECYCRRFSCSPDEFESRALAASLYPHARVIASFSFGVSDAFMIDRSLVNYCGRLTTLREIDAELREYAGLPENRQFRRRTLRFRLSGRRLRRLAQECLRPN